MAQYGSATAALNDAKTRLETALANMDSNAELTTWRKLRKQYAQIKKALAS